MGYPDPERTQKIFDRLDLLVSVTFSWSETAWYSDVVLPLSPYLERECIIATKNALRPHFFVRQRAVAPRYDTRADWQIIAGLARRLGLPELDYTSIEDIWRFQLEGTGVSPEDFDATGMVQLAPAAVYRNRDEIKFKTPSGKIEIIDEKLEKIGISSLAPYVSPQHPPEGAFRLTFGRCAFHTQGHTVNNPLLNKVMCENCLWIHTSVAKKLGIVEKDLVTVAQNGYSGTICAKVTDGIHPEAVFMCHGFGHCLPPETRANGCGLADNRFMKDGLDIWDPAGGAVAYQEHFVTVTKAPEAAGR